MKTLALLVIVGLSVLPISAQDDGLDLLTLTSDGIERNVWLHVPDTVHEPAPLIIALHGRTGSGPRIANHTGFNMIADREGFIIAYPDGVDGAWAYTHDIPGYAAMQDDVAFLTALIDAVAAQHAVDRTRVYVAGFSNGGFMAQRIACEAPAPFAAFASVAATGFGGMSSVCLPPDTISAPMLLIHGTADDNIPWTGRGETRGNRTVYFTYPVPDTLAYWAEFNDCQPAAETDAVPRSGRSPGTSVRRMRVACDPNASVVLVIIEGGGHNWPTSAQQPYPGSGLITRDIDAGEEIWAFFSAHARQQE